jgi:phage major head subunit gpT-like protein
MSKHSRRHQTARLIRAAAKIEAFWTDVVSVEWLKAAEAEEANKPKKFSMVAYTGGPIVLSNYAIPVVIDLAGMTAKAPVPILRDHELGRVVGHADEVEVQEATLKMAGIVSGAGADAAEVVASAGRGFPWKASVGARPDKLEFVGEGVTTKVNGKTFTGPLYVARKSTLGEVSFVALGADRKTSARVAASAAQTQENLDMDFEQWVQALGLTLAELREDQTVKLQAKYDAELKAAATKDGKQIEASQKPPRIEPPKFELHEVALSYEKHVAAIQAKAAEYDGKVDAAKLAEIQRKAGTTAIQAKAKALQEEWPAARLEVELIKAQAAYEVELIRAERPKGPAIHASSRDLAAPAIEAAFCRSCGLSAAAVEKQYKPEVLEAADKSFRNLGIQELLLICAMEAGYSGRMRISDANLREVIKAAFSTHTITTLLTTAGNKILLEGFNLVPQSWREVGGVRSVSDFKSVTAFRLTADLEYEELPPSNKIKHGTMGQDSYSLQAKTYAKMLVLTRPDIINDDLAAFNDLRNRLALGSAIKMNKVFWTAFLAASNAGTFWTAARGNYQSGAGTALGETGLNTAVKLFRDQKGPDNNLLGLEPDRLLVPSDLEATARKLYVSQEMRDTTSSTKYPTTNIYFNRFRPVVVPELSNTGYTGYSATAWWLLCNPAILASIVMCFLNGQQSPTIESADADFETLGIQLRGFHDFGTAMAEYLASVESAGA